jgi:leucyl aminopeptidase (aminopeptidase T)
MTNWTQVKVAKAAASVVRTSLAIQAGEQVAIVADDGSDFAIVDALLAEVRAADAEPTVVVMPEREKAGAPANSVVASALLGANAIIAPTSTGLGFTPTFGEALKAGARGIVMTGIKSQDLMAGAALADYEEVYRVTKPLSDAITAGTTGRVTCPNGSDLTVSLEGVVCGVGASFAREPGQVSGFPSGEAWNAPKAGSANGVLVADGSAHMLGILEEPIRVHFKDGRVSKIEGGRQARELESIIEGVENGDNLGELSIGTNRWARFGGNITEDKKQLGTMHFALGNSVVGGTVKSPIHLDLLITNPTYEVDGTVILKDRTPQVTA